jgi:hypothetical protein
MRPNHAGPIQYKDVTVMPNQSPQAFDRLAPSPYPRRSGTILRDISSVLIARDPQSLGSWARGR